MSAIAAVLLLAQSLAVSAASSPDSPTLVRITASDFEYDVPTTVPSGLVTLRLINAGPDFHHAQLVKLPDGVGRPELRRALARPGPMPGVISMGGPNAVATPDSVDVMVVLQPGRYALICFIPGNDRVPHHRKGMVALFTAEGSADGADPPAADIEIRLKDYEFVISRPVTAGRHTFRIVNEAEQDHEMFIGRLDPGKTTEDFLAWLETLDGPPPAHALGGVVGLSTGQANYFAADLTPGTYTIICFIGDRTDGRPHFLHGMSMDLVVE